MNSQPPRRVIRAGFERIPQVAGMAPHQHAEAYATLLPDGAYALYAYAGRLQVEAGDVVLQSPSDRHADAMQSAGLSLIRLPLRAETSLGGVGRGLDIDDARRVSLTDAYAAAQMLAALLAAAAPRPPAEAEWSDRLAADLAAGPRLRIDAWAAAEGLSREQVARRFRTTFGISPAQFRTELVARNAWFRITGTSEPPSQIAAEAGHADQAHMTRAVRAPTGARPASWRASKSFKTPDRAGRRLPRHLTVADAAGPAEATASGDRHAASELCA